MNHLYILIAATLWGLDGILRRSLYGIPPLVVVFWEHLIGVILIVVFATFIFKIRPRDLFISEKKPLRAIIVVALLSGVIGTAAFTSALQQTNYIPISIVFFIQKLQPIFSIITARIFLKEKPHKLFWAWAIVALLASYVMTFPELKVGLSWPLAPHIMAGALAFIAAASWGGTTAISKIALSKNSPLSTSFMRFMLTTLFAIPAVFLLSGPQSFAVVSPKAMMTLFVISISTGMIALVLYYKGLKHVPAHISSILELAFPITGMLVDVFIFKSHILITQYIAALAITFAIFQIARLSMYAPNNKGQAS